MKAEPLHRLAARMAYIEPFEVMEIQTLARQLEAQGKKVIHMEIGEPDFTTPRPIVDAAIRALNEKPMFYTSALGIMPLREAIAGYYQSKYGVTVAPQRIIVTAGSSAALLLAMGVLLNAGDEVLMADPGYPCNRHFVRTLEAVPRTIAVGPDSAYQLSHEHIQQHWGPRTVATLVASPSNPTGTLVTPDELKAIHTATIARGGTLIVDEIYQGLTYGVAPSTALAFGDDLFVINSFSKYFQMTGWRLGWLVVPPAYVREVETLAQNLVHIGIRAGAIRRAGGVQTRDHCHTRTTACRVRGAARLSYSRPEGDRLWRARGARRRVLHLCRLFEARFRQF